MSANEATSGREPNRRTGRATAIRFVPVPVPVPVPVVVAHGNGDGDGDANEATFGGKPELRPGRATAIRFVPVPVPVPVPVAVAHTSRGIAPRLHAAGATVRNIAEGANRVHSRDKAARFMVARGEVGECEAALQMAQVLSLASSGRLIALRRLADRVAAMLWGLIRRLRE